MFNYYKGEGVNYWMSERTLRFCAAHWHKFYEVELILDGCGVEYINGVRYDVSRGCLTIMPPGAFHSYPSDTPIRFSTFCFTGHFLSPEIRQHLTAAELPWLFHLDEARMKRLTDWLGILRDAMTSNSPERDAIVRRVIELTLLWCAPSESLIRRENAPDDNQELVVRTVLSYIDEHYAERINRDELAESLHYSPSYFSTLFHRISGVTLTEHITDVRMNKAMELLSCSELPVSEVTKRVGYDSESLFYRVFRGYFGANPREVRMKDK